MLPVRVESAVTRSRQSGFVLSCVPGVGGLLAVLAAAVPSNGRILELGTGCGVGLAWIVEGLGVRSDVDVVSIELDHDIAEVARAVDWPRFVSIVEGDAVTLLPTVGDFDLVFADAQGGKWDRLDLTIAALRPRGVLIVDDMSPSRWESDEHKDKTTAVREQLLSDARLTAVEVSQGSGVIIASRVSTDTKPPCRMRKQYSFRQANDGTLDAWDIDRLIRLAADLPVETIGVATIAELDEEYWFADSAEAATVRNVIGHLRLTQEVDTTYPIILDVHGRVMDGMHRVARAVLDGRSTILAVRFTTQPEPDYKNCTPSAVPYDETP